jgi:flagellar biosynthesis regulator FlaF
MKTKEPPLTVEEIVDLLDQAIDAGADDPQTQEILQKSHKTWSQYKQELVETRDGLLAEPRAEMNAAFAEYDVIRIGK